MRSLLLLLTALALPGAVGDVLLELPADPATGDVAVRVALGTPSELRVTFTPPAGFHLYDAATPKAGLQGVGRPTLVEVAPDQAVAAAGPARAEQTPGEPELGLAHYPAGPVDLVLPLRMVAQPNADPTPLTLLVTYMACSDQACQRPITDRRIEVALPVRWVALE